MNLGSKSKSSDDLLDYDIDLSQRWLETGDRIVAAVPTITNGTCVVTETVVSDGAVRVWISGGERGETNLVSIDVTTEAGRVKEFCFHLRITGC